MSLNPRQKRFLRGLTHALQPVVIVGDKGLTENVLAEIEGALDHHELIKIRLRSDRETRTAWAAEIGRATRAERVHAIGQVVCFFRRNPKKAVIELPN
ncbi:MAG: ribosome assembly RNA-binding protein YhbY [Xanthomonadales bacterium]|nr:ribosome assembly RNA-binding protein YhbY [Xanthomonadales bacterium]